MFELIFSIDLTSLEMIVKVLPVLNSPRNPLSTGAGFLEYIYFSFTEGIFPYLLLGILILILLLSNRSFCGWICPIGALQDLLKIIPVKRKPFKQNTHRFLLKVKYVFLVILSVMIIPLGLSRAISFTFYSQFKESLGLIAQKPIGYFSLSEYIFVFFPNIIQEMWDAGTLEPLFTDIGVFVIFVFYIIVIILSVWYPRFYCRYMCPVGAAHSLVSNYAFLKLSRNPVRCVGRQECGICERVCPKQIKILDEPFDYFTGNGECNFCLKCKEACPYIAISFRFG